MRSLRSAVLSVTAVLPLLLAGCADATHRWDTAGTGWAGPAEPRVTDHARTDRATEGAIFVRHGGYHGQRCRRRHFCN
jgi:hypothetical protein